MELSKKQDGSLKNGEKEEVNTNLSSLPSSSHKWWLKAEKYKQPEYNNKPCKHEFRADVGNSATCVKCNVGFMLRGNFRLKDRHIYDGDKLII